MAEEKETNEATGGKAAPEKSKGRSQIMVLVLAMVITVLGALGGVVFWLMKSGRLPVQGGVPQLFRCPTSYQLCPNRTLRFLLLY